MGDTEGAIQSFEAVGLLWPSFSKLRLGELHEGLGDSDQARENYEAFLLMYGGADESGAALLRRGREGLRRLGL